MSAEFVRVSEFCEGVSDLVQGGRVIDRGRHLVRMIACPGLTGGDVRMNISAMSGNFSEVNMKMSRVLIWMVAIGFAVNAFAGERGTADEAKALLQKAVDHYKEVGRARALQDFTGKKTPWVDRDLYVACADSKHILVANGAFPSYVGNSLDATKDLNGVPLGKSFADSAAKGGIQSVEWKWFNPVTGKMEKKVSFVTQVDTDTTCAVGYYKPE